MQMFKLINYELIIFFYLIHSTQSPSPLNQELTPCGSFQCVVNQSTCLLNAEVPICSCFGDYTTYPSDNHTQCNYERKRQLVAFLLEFFVTYGAGHFYTENYKFAISKLVVFVFLYCLFIVLRIVTKAKEENKVANLLICIFAVICFLGMITWQLIDVFKFGYNTYTDGNGIELVPM